MAVAWSSFAGSVPGTRPEKSRERRGLLGMKRGQTAECGKFFALSSDFPLDFLVK